MSLWQKKPGMAEYGGASWDNLVKRMNGVSLAHALASGLADPAVRYFFYCHAPMYLPGRGQFEAGDAVFFSGQPWLGTAPQCDTYLKTKHAVAETEAPSPDSVTVLSLASSQSLGSLYVSTGQALANAAHTAAANQQSANAIGLAATTSSIGALGLGEESDG